MEHQICRFAKMILRDRCSTSYDLASIFRKGTVQDAVQCAVAKSGKGAAQGAVQDAVQSAVAVWQGCCAG